MLDYLWLPLLDRLYRQLPNVWTYLLAKGELDTISWSRVWSRDYSANWAMINKQLMNCNPLWPNKWVLANTSTTMLAINGEQYYRDVLTPVKRISLVEFILPYRLFISIHIYAVNNLLHRLRLIGSKHKFHVIDVSPVCIILQVQPPPVIIERILQVVYELQ